MQKLFMPNNQHPYNVEHLCQFQTSTVNTVYHDTEKVSFFGPNIWATLPDSFKNRTCGSFYKGN